MTYNEGKFINISFPCIKNNSEIQISLYRTNAFHKLFNIDSKIDKYRLIGLYNKQECFELIDNATNFLFTKKYPNEDNIFNLTKDILESLQEAAKVNLRSNCNR